MSKIIYALTGVLFIWTSAAFGQSLEKRIPIVEEMVSKVSVESIIEMHDKIVSFETRNFYSDMESDTRGRGAAQRWMLSKFEEFSKAGGGRLQFYFDNYDQPPTSRSAEKYRELGEETHLLVNVVAILPGRTDNVRYIVNGHYDSRGSNGTDGEVTAPGANDDASGTIVMMELARVLSQYEFDHTLMFVADDGEEQGLLGAHHMAQTAIDEGWEIGGVFADDIVGGVLGGNGKYDGSAIRVFSPGPMDSESRQWARYAKFVGEAYSPNLLINLVFRLDRFGRGGDHRAFIERGFPGARFTELNENFAHQHGDNNDLIEFTNREYMAKVARLQVAILAYAGNSPRKVTNVNVSRDRNDYGTFIRWNHETEETDIAGYKIYIRKTDSGYWQEVVDVGAMEEITITSRNRRTGRETTWTGYRTKLFNRSIDDYVFGVVAYDRDGYVGIAVAAVR
ncbi:M20/M25/M40 family metallo-hydrolase [candidate division KSB1 bacterium]|nr:M20/M25/M40 family metallo-hydrolase [candidate division KSB1 bacterium]